MTDIDVERYQDKCQDRCRGNKASTNEAIEELSRDNSTKAKKKLDRSTSCQEAIEGPGTFSIDPPAVETAIEIRIRNSLRSRQKGQVSRLLKNNFFKKGKTQI